MTPEQNKRMEEFSKKLQNMTDQEKRVIMKVAGVVFGVLSKLILEAHGMRVDYKINGEDIMQLKNLDEPNLRQKIQLAIAEERYEDAAKLKKIIDGNKQGPVPVKNENQKEVFNFQVKKSKRKNK